MTGRLEVRLQQDEHEKINRDGGRKIIDTDGGLLFILPSEEFDGEFWCHEVRRPMDLPTQ